MTAGSAVVLAAEEGTRHRPLTRHRPKALLPATTRPVLDYVLDALVDAGIERLCLVVGHERDRVRNHVGSTYRGVPVSYAVQDKPLGSGHALLAARHEVDGGFLAVDGSRVVEPRTVADVREAFERERPAAALAVVEPDDVSEYDAVEMQGDSVERLVERPETGEYRLVDAGVYASDERLFDAIESTPRVSGELGLSGALSRLADSGATVRGVRTDSLWLDATYPWEVLGVARELLAAGRVAEPERDDRVRVADAATVHGSAVLQPPVAVGPDCEIGPGAVVGPFTAVGRNATVGANAVVERSVLDDDVRVGANVTLIDCLAGQAVRVGAGSTVPGGTGDVRVDGTVHEDLRLGALLADRVTVEGNVSFVPGSLVGPGATLRAGTSVAGTVDERTTVVR